MFLDREEECHLLWNLIFDDLLNVETGGNIPSISSSMLVVFADDVVVVTTGHTTSILQEVTNNALSAIEECQLKKLKSSFLQRRGVIRGLSSIYAV